MAHSGKSAIRARLDRISAALASEAAKLQAEINAGHKPMLKTHAGVFTVTSVRYGEDGLWLVAGGSHWALGNDDRWAGLLAQVHIARVAGWDGAAA